MVYAPSRGSGMKIKILEAMASGVPVVTTSEGVEGLPAVDGVHAGVCEDDAGLIDRTVALLEDPDAAEPPAPRGAAPDRVALRPGADGRRHRIDLRTHAGEADDDATNGATAARGW